MDLKEAIQLAKQYVVDAYAHSGEPINGVGLEETEFDEAAGEWSITVGFNRTRTGSTSAAGVLLEALAASGSRRVFKTVVIDRYGKVIKMRHRETAKSE